VNDEVGEHLVGTAHAGARPNPRPSREGRPGRTPTG
jgi:hypothetical protein